MRDDDVLRVHAGLHAEAAADVADEDVDLLLLDVRQRPGETGGDCRRHLVADPHREAPARRIERRDRAARLHGDRRDPLVHQVELDSNGRARERGFGLLHAAVPHLGGDVIGRVGGERRCVGRGRGGNVGDGGQLLVVDNDAVDRIARGLARFGDHRYDRLADEAHHLVGERAARRHGRATVGTAEVGRRRHRLDGGGRELGAGVDGENARHGASGVGVDRDDARVRMRRTLEGDDRLARLGDVVDEAAAPGEERGVLDAMDGTAAAEAGRRVVERSACAAHPSDAHIALSRSAVQMRGSRCSVASSKARETSNGMQCS